MLIAPKLSLAMILAAFAVPMMADEMPFQGSTSGSFTDAPTAAQLSFAGTGFGAGITSGGNYTLTNLGTFTGILADHTVHLGGSFNLTVAFTIPDGVGNANYTASVSGLINSNNANNILINFNPNGQPINYSGASGSGSFLLTVNDVGPFGNGANTVFTQTLTGSISQATFRPADTKNAEVGSNVPEPTSVALMSTVFGGAALMLYRRRNLALAQPR